MGDGSEGLQDTPAVPRPGRPSSASTRTPTWTATPTAPKRAWAPIPTTRPTSPSPSCSPAAPASRSGSNVVATLSLLNTGLYDAYGVEAVMVAPDDSITITNNTVGGSGRVQAQQAGGRRQPHPAARRCPAAWTAGRPRPACRGGYYTGARRPHLHLHRAVLQPRRLRVGTGTWTLAWNDGAGRQRHAELRRRLRLADPARRGRLRSCKLGLLSGTVYNGNTFTVAGTHAARHLPVHDQPRRRTPSRW